MYNYTVNQTKEPFGVKYFFKKYLCSKPFLSVNAALRAITINAQQFSLDLWSSLVQSRAHVYQVAGPSTSQAFRISRAGILQLPWAPGSVFDHPHSEKISPNM